MFKSNAIKENGVPLSDFCFAQTNTEKTYEKKHQPRSQKDLQFTDFLIKQD